jgi:hypothetical protein
LEKEKTLKSSKTPKIINFEIQEYKWPFSLVINHELY